MQYKFTQERENYEAYASGGVLYAAPGHPAFPIRLANEIFRRCMAYRKAAGASGRCSGGGGTGASGAGSTGSVIGS